MNIDWELALSVGAAVVIFCILFRRLLWSGVKLAGRTALGGGALAVLSLLGCPLGVNLVNALVLGILGVPGLALLWGLSAVTG